MGCPRTRFPNREGPGPPTQDKLVCCPFFSVFFLFYFFTFFLDFFFCLFTRFFFFVFLYRHLTLYTELQEEHHESIVPALLACIDPANGGCPRVLHRALLTLAIVVEACPQGGVMPHAEALLERCVRAAFGAYLPADWCGSLFVVW